MHQVFAYACRTPLHCAASCNRLDLVRLLVEHGASLFSRTHDEDETPLQKCDLAPDAGSELELDAEMTDPKPPASSPAQPTCLHYLSGMRVNSRVLLRRVHIR